MAGNKRYGIWNSITKRFVFNINEDSANRAMRALQRKIGKKAFMYRYTVRTIPQNWRNPANPNYLRLKMHRKYKNE